MVRKYVKKSQRKSWSAERMKMAIEAVIKQGSSIRKASIDNKVPHATLSRKIHLCRCEPEKEIDLIANPKGSNFQTVFNKEQEMLLCHYIDTLEKQLIGVTGMDIRRLAFQIAEKFKLPHRFNKEISTAGEDWYRGFLKRNPEVTVKKPDMSGDKCRVRSKEKMHKFFDLLENTIKKYNLEACNIYNLDETVITCLSKSNATAGTLENNNSVPKEQSKLVTAVICFSASAVYAPLMLIFPVKARSKTLLKGAPTGAWAEYDSTGQMQLNIFVRWLQKFIIFSKASKDNPVLLLVDGYRSYLKNLQVLEMAEENGVHIVCLPLYCTDRLQPIQDSFMKTLSTAYTTEVTNWLHHNPHRALSIHQIYELFGNAFKKVSTIEIPVNSFHNTGIWPINRDHIDQVFDTLDNDDATLTEDNDSEPSVDTTEMVDEDSNENMLNDITDNDLSETDTMQNGVVIISQDNQQPFVIQSIENLNVQNLEQFVQPVYTQQHFVAPNHFVQDSFIKQDCMRSMKAENISLENQVVADDQELQISSVVIPAEAQLSEVRAEDLNSLIQSQRRLYFYVSPYRLNIL